VDVGAGPRNSGEAPPTERIGTKGPVLSEGRVYLLEPTADADVQRLEFDHEVTVCCGTRSDSFASSRRVFVAERARTSVYGPSMRRVGVYCERHARHCYLGAG
jgi:hypothetical protein